MEELEARLLKQGIETQYKYKSGTNEKQGVSFKIGEDCFKGSMVDRKFSFAGLEKALELQHKQLPEQRQKSNNLESYSNQKHTIWQSSQAAVSEDNRKDVSHDTTTGVERTIDILLKPEQRNEQTPYAFSQNANQRKKKRRSQRL